MIMRNVARIISLCVFVMGFGFLWALDVAGAEDRTRIKPVTLNLSTFMHYDHVQIQKVLLPWVENIRKITGGELEIRIMPGSAMGKPEDHYDLAANGMSDISYATLAYSKDRFDLSAVIELPFMTTSAEKMSVALWKVYEKYLGSEFQDVKVLWLFCQSPAHIFTTEKPVNKLSDLTALGIRVNKPAYIQKSLIGLAQPFFMSIPSAYKLIDTGAVDGIGASFESLYDSKQYELIKYGVLCSLYTRNMAIVMNKNKFESLPPHLKKVIEENSGLEMAKKAGRVYDEAEPILKEKVLKSGVQVNALPADDLAKWKERAKKVRAEWAADMEVKGHPGSEILKMASSLLGIK
jgi:TRAP-type C4-dicarboxylate transport system substrate-binding protein